LFFLVSTAIPAHLGPGFTHVVTPLATSHGTLVTPVPVTVVSQGNQVAHIITAASGKVLYINFIPFIGLDYTLGFFGLF